MEIKIRYLGRTMELFGLPATQKEETLCLSDQSLYKDVLERIKQKFLQANKEMQEYDVFNDVAVFSNGRVLRTLKEKPIDHSEVIVAPLIAGG